MFQSLKDLPSRPFPPLTARVNDILKVGGAGNLSGKAPMTLD